MTIAFTKLPGLDAEKLVALVEPVLDKHQVDGVELIWKPDQSGMVLVVSIELPGTTKPGEGVTIDLCAAISRDLSEVLDESDLIRPKYHLEVGSPGVERALYVAADYERFRGQTVKLKTCEPLTETGFESQQTVRGTIAGLDEQGAALIETDQGSLALNLDNIASAHLVFSFGQAGRKAGRPARPAGGGPKSRKNRRSK